MDDLEQKMDLVKNEFLRPTLKLDDQKFEFIFLLDHSGSMNGEKMELAKRALNLILHSLPATCYFNVIYFDHQYTPIFPQSVKYTQENLNYAKGIVSGISAAGGTEILSPLEYVYRNPQIPGYLTQIFSITDGHVSNRSAVLQLVADKVYHSRSFALGIGRGVDHGLIQGIAKNGAGTAEFVVEGEVIESKILHQLKISQRPALLHPIRVAPARIIPMLGA